MEDPSSTLPDSGDREMTQARHIVEHPRDADANLRRKLPLSQLSDDYRQVIELMVYGLDEAGDIEGQRLEAGVPLTLRQACRAVGVRLRRMRDMHATALFQTELNRAVLARRNAEKPKNLTTAIEIRDDMGDNTAATKTVRLKAIQSIEGADRAGVQVTIHNSDSQANIAPGYVIRLRPDRQEPKQIDGEAIEQEPQRA